LFPSRRFLLQKISLEILLLLNYQDGWIRKQRGRIDKIFNCIRRRNYTNRLFNCC
jgi:hypothetical protein